MRRKPVIVAILPGLWLGNLSAALDKSLLQERMISCVVNCTTDCPFIDDKTLYKIRVPVKDNGKDEEMQKYFRLFDKCTSTLKQLLTEHHVLVHCRAGQQRSAALILAFLMRYGHMTLQEALDALKRKKSDIGINFSKSLVQYQISLGMVDL